MALFGDLSSTLNDFIHDKIAIDNNVFKLHRVFTVMLLVIWSVILSLAQYAGDSIECTMHDSPFDQDFIDTNCWIHGTYTKQFNLTECLNKTIAVEDKGGWYDHYASCFPDKGEECWHHLYYQFVPIVLICQAGAFYFPGFLWDMLEFGRVESLVSGLSKWSTFKMIYTGGMYKNAVLAEENDTHKKANELIDNFNDMRGLCTRNWAVKYYVAEALNLVNVIAQYFFTDYFLGNQFWKVGYESWFLDAEITVLPTKASCQFRLGGTGFGTNLQNIICILPKNVITQKFYSAWFMWLIILTAITACMVICRVALTFSPKVRSLLLCWRYGGTTESNKTVIAKCSHGDFLMLIRILVNMPVVLRVPFLELINKRLANK